MFRRAVVGEASDNDLLKAHCDFCSTAKNDLKAPTQLHTVYKVTFVRDNWRITRPKNVEIRQWCGHLIFILKGCSIRFPCPSCMLAEVILIPIIRNKILKYTKYKFEKKIVHIAFCLFFIILPLWV